MKKLPLLAVAILALSTTGCRNHRNYNIVQENYIHKYGVPVSKDDWAKEGQNGKVVQQDSQGVTITSSYQAGILHGDTTYSFANTSTIQKRETYENGQLTKVCTHYTSGVPYYQECFENQTKAEVTSWYEDGTPTYLESYSNGYLIKGEYRTPENEVESRIQDGHGTRICRSMEGQKVAKESFQNGSKIERIDFYANGEPKSVTPFANNLPHGTRLTFLMGGVPNSIEQWVHGLQEGDTVLYQNGARVAKIPYLRGKKEGVAHYYRDNGELAEKISWHEGQMHGPRILFIGETPVRTEWYLGDKAVSRANFERMDCTG